MQTRATDDKVARPVTTHSRYYGAGCKYDRKNSMPNGVKCDRSLCECHTQQTFSAHKQSASHRYEHATQSVRTQHERNIERGARHHADSDATRTQISASNGSCEIFTPARPRVCFVAPDMRSCRAAERACAMGAPAHVARPICMFDRTIAAFAVCRHGNPSRRPAICAS